MLKQWLAIMPLVIICTAENAFDTKGREFMVAFMKNKEAMDGPTDKRIFISTNAYTGAQVNVTVPLYNSSWMEQVYVEFEGVSMVTIPGEIRRLDTGIGTYGIYITSSDEVSVYCVNSDSDSTDGFLGLPIDTLGTEYMALTYDGNPGVVVAGVTDGTTLVIEIPATWTGDFTYDGQSYTGESTLTFTLNQFETFQLVSDSGDLTGTRITSSNPVAVFSGNSHAAITATYTTSHENHLVEQLVPTRSWGEEFVVFATPERYFGDLRVLAREPTTYTFDGATYTLQAQGYNHHELYVNSYYWISADSGISVAVFSRSYAQPYIRFDSLSGGAPSMVLVNPVVLSNIYHTFSTVDYTGGEFTKNYMLIVAHTDDKIGIILDGNPLPTPWVDVRDNSNYVGTYITNLSPGNHSVYTQTHTRGFLAAVFGNAYLNSYGYLAGMRMTRINEPCNLSSTTSGDNLDNDCDGQIDEELDNDIDDDGDGLVDEDLAVPQPVDGNWGQWGSWAACSVTCGTGTGSRSRSRPCDNPVPILPGMYCVGSSTETESCTAVMTTCTVDGNWGTWGSWSTCSATCGNNLGTYTRLRTCDNPAPAYNGSDCPGNNTETATCTGPANPCPVDGNWGTWGSWSTCSATCGNNLGTYTRLRTCDNPAPAYNGSDCPGNDTEIATCTGPANPCPVDGNWETWGSWSICSATCGNNLGTYTRLRTCDNPAPAYNGSDCPGNDTETATCTGPANPCPVDGNWGTWGSWSTCSATCGNNLGTYTRLRTCDNPAPAYNGSDCPGNDTETAPCTGPANPCPVDGNWGTWGSWSICSATCGNNLGTYTRLRTCDNPAPAHNGSDCPGNNTETATCTGPANPCPVDGNWGTWGSWSTCSATCGNNLGTYTRLRTCDNPAPAYNGSDCPGNDTETATCTGPANPCPVDGNWGTWGPWSTCSATCGSNLGTYTRQRTCDNPAPAYNGSDCPGNDTETDTCTGPTNPCPVDGNWGTWGSWSTCSATCGNNLGTYVRLRTCDNPAPAYNGSDCPGNDTETATCTGPANLCPGEGNWGTWGSWSTCSATCGNNLVTYVRLRTCDNPAPAYNVDGNWGTWDSWSTCSATCGNNAGTYTRLRTCDNPAPAYNGSDCTGNDTETATCTGPTTSCPVDGNWGTWESWSTCSATCGNNLGTYTRLRTCNNPAPAYSGSDCPGNDTEAATCTGPANPCPDNGNWGTWGSWNTCSATCGNNLGTYTRLRICDYPSPAYNGSDCQGNDTETDTCTGPPNPCPVDGYWSTWEPWSTCSATCGNNFGTYTRLRTCDNPAPAYNGSDCPGNGTETTACTGSMALCPADGNWGVWGTWTSCTVTCGNDTGTQTRIRACDNPSPSNNGSNCTGSDTEVGPCNTSTPCPVDGNWGTWGSWTTCSATCGNNPGTYTRVRACDNAVPAYNGSDCPGNDTETVTCTGPVESCPVDGNWGIWGSWSICSATCGNNLGTYIRLRTCDNPAPVYNGSDCPGNDTETATCTGPANPCPVHGNWGTWGSWSNCSATCGSNLGTYTRLRACDNPAPAYNGSDCPGNDTETTMCTGPVNPCPVDGNWGTWGSWGTCSATCGNNLGTYTRLRICDNPAPANNGSDCPGNDTETSSCTGPMDSCAENPAWGHWEEWSTCSSTCGSGDGVVVRTRSCESPASENGNMSCSGPNTETKNCTGPNTTCIPVNGSWSEWSEWSSCSVTCGSGLSDRNRSCDSPAPQHGGLACSGESIENKTCFVSHYCLPSLHGNIVLDCVNNYTFGCETENMCLDLLFRCDGTADCVDSSDESPTFTGCALALRSRADPAVPHFLRMVLMILILCLHVL